MLKNRLAKEHESSILHLNRLLVVEGFGINYVGGEHQDHLLSILNNYYEMERDYNGELVYCGIILKYNYEKWYVDISMPNYAHKTPVKYKHEPPRRPHHCPYDLSPKKYGRESNEVTELPESPRVHRWRENKYVQQVVGSFQYYARAIDLIIQQALNAIADEQSNPTEKTLERVSQFLDYMATHPDTVIYVYASDMIFNVHFDASYQTASKIRSRTGGYFFLGSMPKNGDPIILNGNIHVLSAVIKLVASSAAEAELAALFLNAQQARIIRLILREIGHPQPSTPIHINNSTCVGITYQQHAKTVQI